jgi:hypothetical protein
MNAPLPDETVPPVPEIIPWPELQKRAEREGVDIMDYVNSMQAHILNQRDQLARLNRQNEKLRAALRPFAAAATHGERRYALLKAAGEGVMDLCDGFMDIARRHLSVANFRATLEALDG